MTASLSELAAHEVESACGLFDTVFGHQVSPAAWNWKYHDGPRVGQLNLVAHDPALNIIGHIGASVFPGRSRGGALPMAQICDVMVAPAARGGLSSQGIYRTLVVEMGRRLSTKFPGVFAYGFPGARPFKLGARIGVYRRLYECTEALVRRPVMGSFGWSSWTVSREDWDLHRIDRAWRSCVSGLTMLDRTGAYLAWRYRDHPQYRYRCWSVRHWRNDAGWFITRELPDASHCIIDALLPPGVAPAATCGALWRAIARDSAAPPVLKTWFPLPGAQAQAVVPTEFLTNAWQTELSAPMFHPGDTDVF